SRATAPSSPRTPSTHPERLAAASRSPARWRRAGWVPPSRGDLGGAEQRSLGVGARSALRSSFSRRLSERSSRSERSEFRRATPRRAAQGSRCEAPTAVVIAPARRDPARAAPTRRAPARRRQPRMRRPRIAAARQEPGSVISGAPAQSLDARAELAELGLHALVAAVQMIDPLDHGLALG